MMKRFIAYFDYLGFKKFIENNDLEYQKRIIGNNFRDIENALGHGKTKEASRGVIADLEMSIINCINFSDTIVFWTNDDSEDSLLEILKVAYRFNMHAVDFFFPARGALVYDEIIYIDVKKQNEAGGLYNINSVFGKGLVKAHEKAEKQHWAGTVIDNSFIEELANRNYEIDTFLSSYAKKFKVPYKNGHELPDEYVLNIIEGKLTNEGLKNFENRIKENFSRHKKTIDNQYIQEKIDNTLKFLNSFYKND
ncbi:MAG: hypothetical protein AB7S69_11515 [Salinivirgaceae bacterium]